MKILVLGGTRFVGRHLVDAALSGGHEVTLFNRGQSNPELYPELEKLVGDRDGDLVALEGRSWDAVIDVNGYLPRLVADSARLLQTAVKRYLFVSTVSVYADFSQPLHEDSPLSVLSDPEMEEITGESYGPLKVACEQVVQQFFPDNYTIVRPGFIVGPYDYTDRFTYWVDRTRRGGKIAAPGRPHGPTQFIDGRDLAAFMIHLLEADQSGVYNVVGPEESFTFSGLLNRCLAFYGVKADLVWLPESFLGSEERAPAFPFWIPEEAEGGDMVSHAHALAVGLKIRPLEETLQALVEWRDQLEERLKVGLSAEEEEALLGRFSAWEKEENKDSFI